MTEQRREGQAGLESNTADDIVALELKYMKLLQRKIQSLESGFNTPKMNDSLDGFLLNGASSFKTTLAQNGDGPPSEFGDASLPEKKPNVGSAGSVSELQDASGTRVKYRASKLNGSNIREETDAMGEVPESAAEDRVERAVEIVRRYGEKDKYQDTMLKLLDPNLRALFLFVVAHDPWVRGRTHKHEIWLYSPFEPIIHAWDQFEDVVSHDAGRSINEELDKKIKQYSENPLPRRADVLQGLAAFTDQSLLQTAIEDLRSVLDEVKKTPELQYYFRIGRQTLQNKKTVNWDLLWTIFPPGEMVVSNRSFMKREQIFLVESARASDVYEDEENKGLAWELDCWVYDWDGSEFRRVWSRFSIPKYKEDKHIEQLPVYPIKFLTGEQQARLQERLLARGERFRDFVKRPRSGRVFKYQGSALSRGEGFRRLTSVSKKGFLHDAGSISGSFAESSGMSARRITIDDEVIVDFKAFLEHGPAFDGPSPIGDTLRLLEPLGETLCNCELCEENLRLRDNQKCDWDRIKDPTKLNQLQLMMLPPRVLGYWLSRKRWVELDVENFSNDKKVQDERSFKQLQLSPAKKELIKKLIRNHASDAGPQRTMNDLNPEKGNGMVIMLHGPPGVGKTSTAESIARATGKPLLPVNASDIGLDSSVVERRFEVLFELAKTWQAIMLFDEADVFLESRSNSIGDLERNSLVSVLLRSLEYFSGILILTTNRIKQLDVAVQSRINLAIRYPNLTERQKRNIYEGFVHQLSDEDADKSELLDWIRDEDDNETEPFKKLNGRQIRNVLFSAATLASDPNRMGKLKLEHVKKLLRETSEFQDDVRLMLQDARKHNEVAYDINNA